jgi:hypothetical protein
VRGLDLVDRNQRGIKVLIPVRKAGKAYRKRARMFATRLIPISILLLASTSGCAGLQDTEFAVYNWASAEKSWISSTTLSDQWNISSDYRKGWKDGFRAQLNGTGCYVPPAPPPCYWSPKYRACEGKVAIEQWYCGWRAGVAAAACKGDHRLQVSDDAPRLITALNKGCSVQDGCNGALTCNSVLPCYIGSIETSSVSPTAQDYPSSNVEPNYEADVAEPNVLPKTPLSTHEKSERVGPEDSSPSIDLTPDSTEQSSSPSDAPNR